MSNLYNEDYHLWTEKQIEALKNRNVNALDWDNLAVDLDYPKYWINHELTMLICSLLELQFDFDDKDVKRENWKTFIDTNRLRVNGILADCPNYFDKMKDSVPKAYSHAVELMSCRSNANDVQVSFSDTCPFTFEQIIKEAWYPQERPPLRLINHGKQ